MEDGGLYTPLVEGGGEEGTCEYPDGDLVELLSDMTDSGGYAPAIEEGPGEVYAGGR
jgi:hypothetical protein